MKEKIIQVSKKQFIYYKEIKEKIHRIFKFNILTDNFVCNTFVDNIISFDRFTVPESFILNFVLRRYNCEHNKKLNEEIERIGRSIISGKDGVLIILCPIHKKWIEDIEKTNYIFLGIRFLSLKDIKIMNKIN